MPTAEQKFFIGVPPHKWEVPDTWYNGFCRIDGTSPDSERPIRIEKDCAPHVCSSLSCHMFSGISDSEGNIVFRIFQKHEPEWLNLNK